VKKPQYQLIPVLTFLKYRYYTELETLRGTVYFWADFCPVRVKLKIELFKKMIDILNYNAHGVTKIIFRTQRRRKLLREAKHFPTERREF
jgi:hypothetical protein